jgi:hypothetical protein
MSVLAKVLRRRESARNRRAINNAIARASSPAMRDELINIVQRGNSIR